MNVAQPKQAGATVARTRTRAERFLYPLLIIAIAVALATVLYVTRPQLESHDIARASVAVRVSSVEPRDLHLTVQSQGTVQPRTESALIPEVSGTAVWISPSLVSGGRFVSGDVLLRIDDRDYRNNLASAEAAELRARAEAEFARYENERLSTLQSRDLASRSQAENALRGLRVAESGLKEATAALARARLDLERTEIRAPFSGRVRSEQVDLGQFVQRGSPVATLYATDYVEIRLPIADKQLAFLDPELIRSGVAALDEPPPVRLFARFAGRDWNWTGRLVRTEGEIDQKSRMVHVVARVENPEGDGQAPLPVGLFVNAEIRGQLARGVIELPRVAIRDQNRVLVVDGENRLRFRDVELLRIERDSVLVQSGLAAGERVCVSPLQTVVEGMSVTPIPDDGAERS